MPPNQGPSECLGPHCAAMILEWLRNQAEANTTTSASSRQGLLWASAPYQDEAPSIRSTAELAGALEHLEYSVFRRFENQLTRAERARLDNTIRNAMFKIERFLDRLSGPERDEAHARLAPLRDAVRDGRERVERLRNQARRAEQRLAQLSSLTPEGFEEFVAELFEALGYEVERTGGSGDEGADLMATRGGLRAVVQCKYHRRGVVGSPELQKFLGTVHHIRGHKGFFVTTTTFSLAAERFAAENPIELIDGPRLVELVQEALGPAGKKAAEEEAPWF